MKKKLILGAILLAVLVVITVFSVSAEDVVEGIYTYTVNADGETVTIKKITVSETMELNIPSTLGGKTVTAIGDKALAWGSTNKLVTKLTIPNTVVTIGANAFDNNRGISELVIPESVTTIGAQAFIKFDALKNLTIGSNVKTIGEAAFGRTPGLETVTITGGDNDYFKVENNFLIGVKTKTLYAAPNQETITIPAGVQVIDSFVFYGKTAITKVIFPDGLKTIKNNAFNATSNLASIVVPLSLKTVEATAFPNTKLANVYYEGTETNKAGISINSTANAKLTGAKWTYGCCIANEDLEHDYTGDCDTICDVCLKEARIAIADHTFAADGICSVCGAESRFAYEENEDGTLKITKITVATTLENFELEIPSEINGKTVTVIGEKALNWGSASYVVTKLTIPNTVKTIETFAFANNRGITELVIPDSVETLGEEAFSKLEGLKTLTIGKGLNTVGLAAFGRMPSLESITVAAENTALKVENNCLIYTNGEDVKVIAALAVDTIVVPEGVTSISKQAFYNSVVTTITLPESLVSIGAETFYQSKLTAVEIPGAVQYIGDSAFYNVDTLTEVTFNEGLIQINDNAFYHCGAITEIILPQSLKKIMAGAFKYCTAAETVLIGTNVHTIEDNAFEQMSSLQTLTLPRSLTTVGYAAFANGGNAIRYGKIYYEGNEETFAKITFGEANNNILLCGEAEKTLENGTVVKGTFTYNACIVNAPSFVHIYTADADCDTECDACLKETRTSSVAHTVGEDGMCGVCGTESRYVTEENEDGTLTIVDIIVDNTATNVVLDIPSTLNGKTITAIGPSALSWGSANYAVVELNLPSTLKTIGKNAFSNNRGITTLVIPNSVETIGADAFAKLEALTTLNIGTGLKTVGERAFGRTKALTTLTVAAGNTAFKVENDCLIDIANKKVLTAKALATITIPAGVEVIGEQAFYNSVVTSVTFPASLKTIGAQAFYGAKPTSVVLTSVTEIGYQAFYGNKSLTTLTLGNSLEAIGYEAFRGCTGIASVVLPSGFKTMGYNAFYGCSAIRTVVIPKSVTEIGYGAFVNCGLKSANNAHVYYEGTRAEYEAINWTLNPSAGTTQNNDVIAEDASRATKHYNVCLATANYAEHNLVNGTCTVCGMKAVYEENGFMYEINSDGKTVTVTAYIGTATELVIPATLGGMDVTVIGADAFGGSADLKDETTTSITIPNTVKVIGARAFMNMRGVTAVVIPESVETIEEEAFFMMKNLKTITIGSNVQTMGDRAFGYNAVLESITIVGGDNLYFNFQGNCLIDVAKKTVITSLNVADITIPAGVEVIGDRAFYAHAAITEISIPHGVKVIGEGAFDSTNLSTLALPSTVETIGYAAFANSKLKSGTVNYAGTEADFAAITIDTANNNLIQCTNITYSAACTHTFSAWKFVSTKSYTVNRTCIACGATETKTADNILKLKNASLTLDSSVQLNFNVDQSTLDGIYANAYMYFEVLNKDGSDGSRRVYEARVDNAKGYYIYDLIGLAPDMMGDTVKATLFATYNGELYESSTIEYSISKYCYSELKKSATAERYRLIVDLLNYGAAAQEATGYKTDALVNKDLTAAQLAYGTPAANFVEPTSDLSQVNKITENVLVKWLNPNMLLGDKVDLGIYFTATSLDGFTIEISYGDTVEIITAENMDEWVTAAPTASNAYRYRLNVNGVGMHQMREPITFVAYDADGNQVSSSVLTYSIQSFANGKTTTSTATGRLFRALITYGDAAKAYVDSL